MTFMSQPQENPGKGPEFLKKTPETQPLEDRPETVNKVFQTLYQYTFQGKGTDPLVQDLNTGQKKTEYGVTTWRTEDGILQDAKTPAEKSDEFKVLDEAVFYGENYADSAVDQEKPVLDKYVSREFIAEKADVPITVVSKVFKALNAIGDQEIIDVKRPVPRKNTVFLGLGSEAFLDILKHVFQHRFFELSEQEEKQFEHFAARVFIPKKLFYWNADEEKAVNNLDIQILQQMQGLYVGYTANQEDPVINQMKEEVSSKVEEQFYDGKDQVELGEKQSNTFYQNNLVLNRKLMPLIRKTLFIDQIQQTVDDKSLDSERKLIGYLGKEVLDSRNDSDQSMTEEITTHIQEEFDQSDIYEKQYSNSASSS